MYGSDIVQIASRVARRKWESLKIKQKKNARSYYRWLWGMYEWDEETVPVGKKKKNIMHTYKK
jgi:hypothetical protein